MTRHPTVATQARGNDRQASPSPTLRTSERSCIEAVLPAASLLSRRASRSAYISSTKPEEIYQAKGVGLNWQKGGEKGSVVSSRVPYNTGGESKERHANDCNHRSKNPSA